MTDSDIILPVSLLDQQLIDPWFTETEWSRERALQAIFHALVAFKEKFHLPVSYLLFSLLAICERLRGSSFIWSLNWNPIPYIC